MTLHQMSEIIEIPNRIECVVLADGAPLSGVFVRLTLHTNYKNDYSFLVGPTDSMGKVALTREELLERAEDKLQGAIMDYGRLSNVYAGKASATLLSAHDLEKAATTASRSGRDQTEIAYRLNALGEAAAVIDRHKYKKLTAEVVLDNPHR